MNNTTICFDDQVIGIKIKGKLVLSYPRRVWEPSREINGTRYWSSRERTEEEKKLLRSLLKMKADEMNGRTSGRIVGKKSSPQIGRPGLRLAA